MRVRRVALDAVKMRVHPGRVDPVEIVDEIVCPLPIALVVERDPATVEQHERDLVQVPPPLSHLKRQRTLPVVRSNAVSTPSSKT